jgi:hypothetical protein
VVTEKLVVYVDDRTDLGRAALHLLAGVGATAPIITIPVDGGFPVVVRGRSRYTGLEEIKLLVDELRKNV